ncbi:WEB family protein At5g55860 [Nicotiana tabacum]|uniref:WEB family protein At5g55860 n=4 Tax=Nicotiana tabacum TaxID=4097 RepID=A0AC58T0M4_TOBAC|nr:WEB family protein At5g55860 [Nicotiana tomentosiformis]XP_009620496.1 WEB family protein At5g55860 [Nicotiana tomentosiformis]XP_033516185.1 WEB family protein At5g55860 [Nicotiana tomentosiformis]
MVAKDHKKPTGSPNVQVGEIDTSAPFQSVKDAVNLFGEGAFSVEKPAIKKAKPQSAERVLAKETQLHLAQKELNKLKEQLKNAETTKDQALTELERAKRTVEDLTHKLKLVCESKDSAIKATEAAKSQVNQLEEAIDGSVIGNDGSWKVDLETARETYMAEIADLNTAKQELRKIRQDCNTSMEEKAVAIEQAAEAERTAKANVERARELSKEIAAVQESIDQLKLACVQEREEEAKIYAEKDVQKQSYKAKLEESAEKLLALRKKTNGDIARSLEAQLAETTSEIEALRKEMDSTKSSDLDTVTAVTAELDDAKESLHKVAEEESTLQTLLETLKLELESVKKEHSDLKEKEAETESLAVGLHIKLRKVKSELEVAVAEESRARGASEEMISTLHQLTLETENAKLEAEEMKKQAEELKREAEATRMAFEEAEKKLKVAMEEAEEAKSAEAGARDEIKILSEKNTTARSSMSESGSRVTLSKDEFDSLSRKAEEFDKLAEIRVGAVIAQVEAVKASENEALKKLDATQKEIDDIKSATQEALKKAEMAEAAKKAVEGELRRWREREQKKAAESASRILAEQQMNYGSSPQGYRVEKEKPSEKFTESHSKMHPPPVETWKQSSHEQITESRKLQKAKTSVSKKKVLMPNISGIFHKKKNQVEGSSPSYLPGEKPVW